MLMIMLRRVFTFQETMKRMKVCVWVEGNALSSVIFTPTLVLIRLIRLILNLLLQPFRRLLSQCSL